MFQAMRTPATAYRITLEMPRAVPVEVDSTMMIRAAASAMNATPQTAVVTLKAWRNSRYRHRSPTRRRTRGGRQPVGGRPVESGVSWIKLPSQHYRGPEQRSRRLPKSLSRVQHGYGEYPSCQTHPIPGRMALLEAFVAHYV